MKLKSTASVLRAAVQAVAPAIPSRTTKTIFRNILLKEIGGKAWLYATDSEVSIAMAANVEIIEPGTTLLPAARLMQILGELGDKETLVSVEEPGKVLISTQGSEFSLTVEDHAEFPPIPVEPRQTPVSIVGASLRKIIKGTAFACDTESTRYALGAVCFEISDERRLVAIATDSRRLAIAQCEPIKCDVASLPNNNNLLVPERAVRMIERCVKPEDTVGIDAQVNSVMFVTSDMIIHSQLLVGRFPGWRKVLPSTHESRTLLPSNMFASLIRQSMITTTEESRGITLSFGQSLKLESGVADVGMSKVEMPIVLEGSPISVTLDPRFLLEFLKSGDGEAVDVKLISHEDPVVLSTSSATYIQMPISKDK